MAERLVSLGVALLVTIPVARYLGPADFGILSYVLAVSAITGPLASLGLNHIVTKELVEHPDAAGSILGTVALLRKLGALAATLCVLAWVVVVPPGDPRLPFYMVLIVGAGFVGSMTFLQYWFLTNGTMNAYAAAQVANTLFFSLVRIGQVFLGASLDAFIVVAAIEVLTSGLLTYVAYRMVRSDRVAWTWDTTRARKLLSRSWTLTISGLTAAVYLKLDLIMLAEIGTAAEAGIYGAAARLSEIWYFVPTLLMTAMFPALLDFRSRSDILYRRRLQDILDVLAAAGTLLAIVISFTAPFIVDLLFGPAFAGAATILSIHIWSGVFIFMRALLSKWFIAEDLYTFSLVTHGLGAVANIVLNLVLIPAWGGVGAAIATLVSYAVASYVSLLVHPKTRPVFFMMTRALFWPRRLPELVEQARKLITGRA